MTCGSRLDKVGLSWSVGGFHGIQAYSAVFEAPSYYSQDLHRSGENGARVSSGRGCLMWSLLSGDVFLFGLLVCSLYILGDLVV
jgi:hypothetical protein